MSDLNHPALIRARQKEAEALERVSSLERQLEEATGRVKELEGKLRQAERNLDWGGIVAAELAEGKSATDVRSLGLQLRRDAETARVVLDGPEPKAKASSTSASLARLQGEEEGN